MMRTGCARRLRRRRGVRSRETSSAATNAGAASTTARPDSAPVGAHHEPGPVASDRAGRRADPDARRADAFEQARGELARRHPSASGTSAPASRGGPSARGLRAADQAPFVALPRARAPGTSRRRAEPVDVAREQPAEERCRSHVGRLIAQAPTHQRTERLLGPSAVCGLRNRSVQRAGALPAPDTPGQRMTSPMSPGMPNGAPQERDQPAIGPEARALRARVRAAPAARALGTGPPPTACGRRTSPAPRLELETSPTVHGAELAAGRARTFEHGDVERRPLGQPVRGRQAGDPAAPITTTRPGIVISPAPPPACSRTTSASTSRNAGSAFGISVRSNRAPACSAISLRLDVEVVEDLQVVGDEPGRAHDHGRASRPTRARRSRPRSAGPTTGRPCDRRSATRSGAAQAEPRRDQVGGLLQPVAVPARVLAVAASCIAASRRRASGRAGECAEKITRRARALVRRSVARAPRRPARSGTPMNAGMVVVRADERERGRAAIVLRRLRSRARCSVSTDIPDQCGAITMPIARSMPSARIAVDRLGMNGGECFIPRYARNASGPPRSSSALDDALRLRARRVQQREHVADRRVAVAAAPRGARAWAAGPRGCPCSSARCRRGRSRSRTPSPARRSGASLTRRLVAVARAPGRRGVAGARRVGGRQHAVAEVEHVAVAAVRGSASTSTASRLDRVPRRRAARAGSRLPCTRASPARCAPTRVVERDPPVDADHVAARVAHQREQLAGAHAEVDRGHAEVRQRRRRAGACAAARSARSRVGPSAPTHESNSCTACAPASTCARRCAARWRRGASISASHSVGLAVASAPSSARASATGRPRPGSSRA